jgi:hypothetical protein
MLDEPSSFEEAYVEHVWWDVVKISSKPISKSVIDPRLPLMGVL